MMYVKGNDLVARTMISCCVRQLVDGKLCYIYQEDGIFDELSPARHAGRQVVSSYIFSVGFQGGMDLWVE